MSEPAVDETIVDAEVPAVPEETNVETAAIEPVLDAAEEITKETADTAAEPVAKQDTGVAAPGPSRSSSKRQSPSFMDWLMQPYQLALAILVPLLLAAIIWYVIYVRRVNREIAGTYNGARQAAEREKQDLGSSEPEQSEVDDNSVADEEL
ncbi:hypothetical protein C9928_07570, partial [Pseudidiomarina aestuarii]